MILIPGSIWQRTAAGWPTKKAVVVPTSVGDGRRCWSGVGVVVVVCVVGDFMIRRAIMHCGMSGNVIVVRRVDLTCNYLVNLPAVYINEVLDLAD